MFAFVCVGMTHSGKTSFSREWCKKNSTTIMIDNDEIREWVVDHYNSVHVKEWEVGSWRSFEKPKLIGGLLKTLVTHSAGVWQSVILSGGNIRKGWRKKLFTFLDSLWYTIILLYFDVDVETIRERVASSKKEKKILVFSKTFEKLIDKQLSIYEKPNSDETEHIISISESLSTQDIIHLVSKYISWEL